MVMLSTVPGERSGLLYHLRLWVLAVRVTVLGRVSGLRTSAGHSVESEHVIMVVGYGSMTLVHSNALMLVAYVTVTVVHLRHVRRHG